MNILTTPIIAIAGVLTVGAIGLAVSTSTGDSFQKIDAAVASRTELGLLLSRAEVDVSLDAADGYGIVAQPSMFASNAKISTCFWNIGQSSSAQVGREQYLAGPEYPSPSTPIAAFIDAGLNGVVETGCADVLARAQAGAVLETGDDIAVILLHNAMGKESWTNLVDSHPQSRHTNTLRNGQVVLQGRGEHIYAMAWNSNSWQFVAPGSNSQERQSFVPACGKSGTGANNNMLNDMLLIPAAQLPSGRTVPSFCIQRYAARSPQSSDMANASGYQATAVGAQQHCQAQGLDLMSDDQWQSVAKQGAASPLNWTGGVVGRGQMVVGVSGSAGTQAPLGTNDTLAPYSGSGHSAPSPYRRTVFIGENTVALWDFVGNWHWTKNRIDRTVVAENDQTLEAYPFLPINDRPVSSWVSANQGTGSYFGTRAAPYTLAGFAPYNCTVTGPCERAWELSTLRGGDGLYALRYSESPVGSRAYFRCTYSPYLDKQD